MLKISKQSANHGRKRRMSLKRIWKNYKFRFTPWIAYNFLDKAEKPKTSKVIDEETLSEDLVNLLGQFKVVPYKIVFKNSKGREKSFAHSHVENSKVLLVQEGFQLVLKSSSISGAGRGVFVKEGKIKAGQIACLYPGLIYQPHHPILLASVRNAYIFRCADATLIDGKSKGLSAVMYKSVHGRERMNGFEPM